MKSHMLRLCCFCVRGTFCYNGKAYDMLLNERVVRKAHYIIIINIKCHVIRPKYYIGCDHARRI